MESKKRIRAADRAGRLPMQSPGRPPVWRREHKQLFWKAISRGLSSEEVASVSPAVGGRWFREGGGMATVSTARHSGRYLSFGEREEIALLRAQACDVREIARRLGRASSTISRELRRNAATRSGAFQYRATTAQWHADRRAQRPKKVKLATNRALRQYVQERLAGTLKTPNGTNVPGPKIRWKGRRHGPRQDRKWAVAWSPEQISNRLPVDFPDDASMRISHEAIYQALYVQGRGKSFVRPEIMIGERPAEADDRAVPGHWEGDLILGLDSSAIGTLVERSTRFTILMRLPRMDGGGTAG
jgi:IS30 family transposase